MVPESLPDRPPGKDAGSAGVHVVNGLPKGALMYAS